MTDATILRGRIFTAEAARPWADAIAFDLSRILAVGTLEDAQEAAPAAERIDVGNRTVVPGFIDAHNHFLATGESLASLDVRYPGVASVEDLIAAVRTAASVTAPGRTIRAFGFDHAKYERAPTRWDLDAATEAHPVVVHHVSGHHVLVSSSVLERSGVTAGTPDPPGGELVRDVEDRITGLCLDAAMGLVLPVEVDIGHHGPNFHTRASLDDLVADVERAGLAFLRAGLTTVCDAQVTLREMRAYRHAQAVGRLPLRTVAMPLSHQLEAFRSIGVAGPFGDDELRIGALKVYADGSLIGGTALFSEPYGNDGEFAGSLYSTEGELRRIIGAAHADGWQVGVHVQGDRAISLVLDAIDAAASSEPREHRHRLEHAGYPTRDQIRRIAELGVLTVNQPRYLFDSGDEFLERLGPRAHGLIPLRDELDAGVRVVLSSDSDVCSYRPMDTIASAVARRTHAGEEIGPGQALTIEEALVAHTLHGAYALFAEDRLGSLAPGKLPDVVVLDTDLTTVPAGELSSVDVAMTFLGGRAVHGDVV